VVPNSPNASIEAHEGVEIESSALAVFGDQVVVAGAVGSGAAIWVGPLNG